MKAVRKVDRKRGCKCLISCSACFLAKNALLSSWTTDLIALPVGDAIVGNPRDRVFGGS
jgi:hypothetical protein